MQVIIEYFSFVVNKIISILDTLKFPGSSSLLYYFLGAIIIGLIIKLVKGGSSEFEQNTNFLNSRIIATGSSKYKMSNDARKIQIEKEKNKVNPSKTYLRLSPSQTHHFGGRTRVTLQEYNERFKD